jgi:hypothetical protein
MRARFRIKLEPRLVVVGATCLATLVATSVAWGRIGDPSPASPSRNPLVPTQPAAPSTDPNTSASSSADASSSTQQTGSVSLTNTTWRCGATVSLDSVSVTMTSGENKPAIVLGKNCTGTIKSVQIFTNGQDGIHVNNDAHDITVAGGTITCQGHAPLAHQDGIQVMSGSHVTFSNLTINCPTANNADFFVNWSGDLRVSQPSNILCVSCRLYGTQSSTAFIAAHSSQSGLKNSTLCPSRYFTYRKNSSTAVDQSNAYPKSC